MHGFGVQGFRVEDSGFRGLRVAGLRVWRFSVEKSGCRVFGFRELGSAIGDDRIRGFVDSFARLSGISFWRVGAGLAVQNVRFRSFGFKGSELGVEDCGFGVRID